MFDEVFTGLYRLGRFSAASFLGVHPDISVNAKLLTGGLLPLSITAASNSIFQAFWGDEKSEALLHGHSYTAHAVGCHVANRSLETMKRLHTSKQWDDFRLPWSPKLQGLSTKTRERRRDECTWSMWSKSFVESVSEHERVEHVNALGSVLAVSLIDEGGSGMSYQSLP
jgi:dethiobiotin synthetase/adenosylmethionine--8-amino-7-oxononanoate aminotransferase